MATFANAGFNTVLYAAARPTYPRQLFDLIFRFHEFGSSVVSGSNTGINESGRAKYNVAVDLGCGTGRLNALFVVYDTLLTRYVFYRASNG